MSESFVLFYYGTRSWNRQIVNSVTFAIRIKYMEMLQQFAGHIIFSFYTCILNIEARTF